MVQDKRNKYESELRSMQEQADKLICSTKSSIWRWLARAGDILVGGVATLASGGGLAPAAVLLYGGVEAAAQVQKHYEEK
jgi:hypothetical protein